MAKQIRRSEISEEDLFKNIRESALDTIKILSKFDAELKKVAATAKGDLGAKGDSSAEIKKKTAAMNQANKAKKASIQIDKQMAQARKQVVNSEIQLEKIKREKLKTEREELRNAQAKAKASERTARAVENERNAYKRLVVETRNQKNESKRLAARLIELEAAGKKNTRGFRDLQRQYKEVTRAAQKGDVQLKKIDKTVGDNFRNVGNYSGALGKLKSGLAQLGLAFGAFSVVRNATQTVAEFQTQVADLSAITGLEITGEKMQVLKQNALNFSSEFGIASSEIIEAFKLAGSARPELLQNAEALSELTKKAVILSKASGDDLQSSIQSLAGTLNAFDKPATEAGAVMDILANAAQQGTKEIPFLTQAFEKFGGIAAANGVEINESAAAMEFLGKKIPDAAQAGTNFRNILLKLSAPGTLPKEALESLKELGVETETLADKSLPLNERLAELTPLLKDNEALVRVFGTQNSLAAQTLIQNASAIGEFGENINQSGTAIEQMNTKSQTLSEAFNRLTQNWNNFIIELTEGSGATSSLTEFVDFLADNLPEILSLLISVTKQFVIFKTAMFALKMRDRIMEFGGLVKGIRNGSKSLKDASDNAKKFGRALSGIAFTVAINAVVKLGTALWNAFTGATELERALRSIDQYKQRATEQVSERTQKRTEELDKTIRELERKLETGEITQAQFDEQRKKEIGKTSERVIKDIELVQQKRKQSIQQLDLAQKKLDKIGQFQVDRVLAEANLVGDDLVVGADADILKMIRNRDKLLGKTEALTEKEKLYNKENDDLIERYKEVNHEENVRNIERPKLTDATNKAADATKELNTELQFQIDLEKELRDIENERLSNQLEYNEILRDRATTQLTRDIDELKESTLDLVKAQGLQVGFDEFGNVFAIAEKGVEIDKVTTKAIAQYNQLNKLIDERAQLEKDSITATRDFEIEEQKRAFRERFADLRAELEAEEIELLSQEGLVPDSAEFNEIKRQVQEQRDKINDLEKAEFENLKKNIRNIEEDAQNGLKDVENERLDTKKEVDDEMLKANEEFNNSKIKQDADALKKQQEQEKKAAEARIAIVQALTEKAIQASNKRIEKLDEEISNAKTQQDFFRKLAAEGNIAAQQSLAEQAEIEREARIQREKELKQQARIQLASSAYSTYQSKVAAGSDKPLAETIRDISFLQAFIQNIPLFEEGTEDTGANGQGVDGRGGFHAILHPNERVMTKEQNKMVGAMSNIELAQLAQEYNAGKIVRQGEGAIQIGNNWNSAAILAKLNELNETVKNKPEIDYKVEEIIAGMMKIRKSEKRGNTIIHNKYRLK